jgi:hypothetical protein
MGSESVSQLAQPGGQMRNVPLITKVRNWKWAKWPSKHIVVEVETAGRRLALRLSLPAALALEEAIRNAWAADYLF